MSRTQMDGQQILDGTITRSDLITNILNGTDWDLTGGAENATITGLAEGSADSDVVVMSQYHALEALLQQSIVLRGGLTAPADMTGTATGNAYIDAGNGYGIGDKFLIAGSGNLTLSDGTVAVNEGDSITILNLVATNAAITVADIWKTDNTESADIIRTGDVVDSLASQVVDKPLSANQGYILDGKVNTINNARLQPVLGEVLTATIGSPTLSTLANAPYNAEVALFIGGNRLMAGSGNDYTISGQVITLEYNMWRNKNIVVDYNYILPLSL